MSKEQELVERMCVYVKHIHVCEDCAVKKRTPEENLKKFYSIFNYPGSIGKEELLIEIKAMYPDLPELKIKIKE